MDNICFECVSGGGGRPKVSFLIKNDLRELRELWTLDSHSVAKKKITGCKLCFNLHFK